MSKLLFIAACVALASAVLTEDMVSHINSAQKDWKAQFSGEVGRHHFPMPRKFMMDKPHLGVSIPRKTYSAAERAAVPAAFDSRTNWPQCSTIRQIRDQSHCGSCWAFGSAEAISDRWCIVNKEDVALSVEIMNSCSGAGSCNGGQLYDAWVSWKKDGLPSEACRPYSLPGCDHHLPNSSNPCPTGPEYPTPACVKKCVDGYNATYKADLRYGASVYSVEGEADMMAELVNHGPFEVAIDVYDDFEAYRSGIYHHVSGEEEGGHAIRLLGYGVENGVKYWTLANSWNPHWGENGFFRMRRGNNECGVEDEGVAGMPRSL